MTKIGLVKIQSNTLNETNKHCEPAKKTLRTNKTTLRTSQGSISFFCHVFFLFVYKLKINWNKIGLVEIKSNTSDEPSNTSDEPSNTSDDPKQTLVTSQGNTCQKQLSFVCHRRDY